MSDNRQDSQGSRLKMGDAASPETFTTIEELTSIPAFGQGYNPRDRTTLEDTAPNTAHGFMTEDTQTISVAWNPTGAVQLAMVVACNAKVAKNFQITLPTSPVTTKAFTGKILKYSAPYPTGVDTDLMIDFTITKTSVFS